MRSKIYLTILCLASLVLPLAVKAAGPTYEELRPQLKKVHPRLFLTPETRKTFADDVKRLAMKDFEELKAHIDSLPDEPKITLNPRYTKMKGDKVIFIRNKGDQNHLTNGLKNGDAGLAAVEAAIAYFVTGEARYREKAIRYLYYANEVFALADRSRIMPEWYHYNRLCALAAWDWLYPELTAEQRKEIIVPLILHIDHMQKANYRKDNGGPESGNYGEPGLMWFAGVTAAGDGFCDEVAESLLERGYKHAKKMMDFRDKSSGGSGVLASIAEGYTFAHYPYATFNFLHTIQSGFGVDGTKYWNQMRDYPKSVAWMTIPYRGVGEEFLNYGWGDTCHYRNNIWGMPMLYTHMAQCIHFYGENPVARAILAHVPEKMQRYGALSSLPFLPFVIQKFDPKANVCADPAKALDTGIAYAFPSFGLSVMRSGFGPDDTYAAFKGGAEFGNHMHYDENTFVLYKKGFQAMDTGCRGNTPHHLLYYAQTIAHNGMLIRMDGEKPANHWYPANAPHIPEEENFGDGGMISKTSAIPIPLSTGKLHADCGSDATACYDERKCKEAIRQFVYLKPDYFVVYDRVTSVKPDQQKVFLLHAQGEYLQKNGVWESSADRGKLFCRTMLPKEIKSEIIGGVDREFVIRGVNYPANDYAEKMKNDPEFWLGRYRLELSPAKAENRARFLHVMECADGGKTGMVPAELIQDDKHDGVRVTGKDGTVFTVRFLRDGKPGGDITVEQNGKVLYTQKLSTTVAR